MRPISWLHVSDIHMRPSDAWAQEVVMRALCDDVAVRRSDCSPDFILVTGDLAYSGKAEEYALVESFLDDLVTASGVQKELIFSIPGNHDIDRDRQKLCFRGAQAALQDQSSIDNFLGSPTAEDFETLLKRQENYRAFQRSYFSGQDRTPTHEGLGYVARLTIDGVRLVIVGLDSSWLAQGGDEDHTRLLIGERQVINAIRLAQEQDDPPHIVVAMGHHPLHLLQDFDRHPVQTRIESSCHFYHCGHLHNPEERAAGQSPSGCLTLAAGASFQSRQFHNTYSIVTIDLLLAQRSVRTLRFNPSDGAFESVSTKEFGIEVSPSGSCSVREMADALDGHGGISRAYYLAALILDKKAEVPVPSSPGHTLASLPVMQSQPDGDLKKKTLAFFTFRNALRVLYGCESLEEILRRHGGVVTEYSAALSDLCDADPSLRDRLDAQDQDSSRLAQTQPQSSFSHTSSLLKELASAREWDLLRAQAERNLDSTDMALASQARRSLALAFAHSDDLEDQRQAAELYRSLSQVQPQVPTDTVNLATLLLEIGHLDEAKAAVLEGIAMFPEARDQLGRIGQRIVEATGNREFRDQLRTAMAGNYGE